VLKKPRGRRAAAREPRVLWLARERWGRREQVNDDQRGRWATGNKCAQSRWPEEDGTRRCTRTISPPSLCLWRWRSARTEEGDDAGGVRFCANGCDRASTVALDRRSDGPRGGPNGPTDQSHPIKIVRRGEEQGGVKRYATRIVRLEINGPQRERQRNWARYS